MRNGETTDPDPEALLAALQRLMVQGPAVTPAPFGKPEALSRDERPPSDAVSAEKRPLSVSLLPHPRHGDNQFATTGSLIDDATVTALGALIGDWVQGTGACPVSSAPTRKLPAPKPGERAREVPKVAPDLDARLGQMQEAIMLRLADAIRVLEAAPLCGYEPSAAVRALRRLKTALERPCRILLIGETCTGKTSLANLLIGSAVLPTHELPNTRISTLIAYFERPKIEAVPPDGRRRRLEVTTERSAADYQRLLLGLPLPFLKKFEVLDTPALDAQRPITSEQYLREHRADIVLWCTSSSQAWSASERTFWSLQPSRLKSRSLLVITHGDLLTPASNREQLVRRLRQEIGGEFRDALVLCTCQPPADGFDSSDVEGRRMSDWLEALAFEARAQRVEAVRRSAARISQRVLARIG